MDLFTLDSQLRRTSIFDTYRSLIWTERFSAYGDFELVINSSLDARNSFQPGTRLAINESTRVMVVETVIDRTTSDGRTLLTVKGPSIEEVLDDRVAQNTMVGSSTEPNWTITGTPASIARWIFKRICIDGALNLGDILPFYTAGSIYPTDNITEPPNSVSMIIPKVTVYAAIKQICDIYGLGFRLVRNGDRSQLMFNVYAGNDRTTLQSALPAVIFSPELDNLSDVSFLTSTSAFKNVAYVVAPNGSRTVYANGFDETIAGFDRKILYVDANDITDDAGAVLDAKLEQRGKQQLALNTNLAAFDGEITKNSQYRYNKHYQLGDVVELRNSDNATNQMVVTEQIFVSDDQGDRQYPTLTVKLLITPGSWYALPAGQVWDDLTDTGDTWASRP